MNWRKLNEEFLEDVKTHCIDHRRLVLVYDPTDEENPYDILSMVYGTTIFKNGICERVDLSFFPLRYLHEANGSCAMIDEEVLKTYTHFCIIRNPYYEVE